MDNECIAKALHEFSLQTKQGFVCVCVLTAAITEFLCCSVTELLILAHHCFSLTCHMEGITRVLQAARLLTDEHLAPNDEYGLMVRVFAPCLLPGDV